MLKPCCYTPLLLAALTAPAIANETSPTIDDKASATRLEEVTIIGSKEKARELPGSAYVLDESDLEIFNDSDINKILQQVPGVYMQQEEGYGLRPNIGIRGSGTGRSSKITLMVDGVLMAPAPYSNPDAYYFPTAGRMATVEVLKGPSVLREGPFTVGGALNMVTTAIPQEAAGKVGVEVGQYGENRIKANYGDSGDNYGWLLETYQQKADGFKDIDRSHRDAGFEIQDYMGKLRFNTPDSYNGRYQQLDLKAQYSEETSNSSYIGLTDSDFDADPNRRYGLSDLDQMDNRHSSISANYLFSATDNLDLSALIYYNKFKRNWFKVDKINDTKLGSFFQTANDGDSGNIAILHGTATANLDIKHNNRDYTSKGVQLSLDWSFNTFGIDNQLTSGIRAHKDEMDRYQPVEKYLQTATGSLNYLSTNEPTGGSNQFDKGEALSFWILDTISMTEKLDVTLALRYEDIDTRRTEYDDADRTIVGDSNKNNTEEWLPGIGATYQLNESWQLLGGIYKGMAPTGASASNGTDPELSVNSELGFRFNRGAFAADVIGFYSDYENSVINCTVAHECPNGANSGTYQAGEAEVEGVEVSANYSVEGAGMSWPMQASYTYTKAKVTKASSDTNDDGIKKGQLYPYIPENLFYASVGMISPQGWDLYLAANYSEGACSEFTNDCSMSNFTKTENLWTLDAVTHYQLTSTANVYLKVNNLLDEQKIVSRDPAGARPNAPRTVLIGLDISF